MGKKKRSRKTTVFCSVEGHDEALFLEYLKELYSDQGTMNFPDNPIRGGSGDHILSFAIKSCHFDRSFAWIDEDVDLNRESREKLAQCWGVDTQELIATPLNKIQEVFNSRNTNPVLIVSQPICFESLILRILGKNIPYAEYEPDKRKMQIKNLKSALAGVLGLEPPLEYYRKNLDKEILGVKRKKIPELELLIQMVSKINLTK